MKFAALLLFAIVLLSCRTAPVYMGTPIETSLPTGTQAPVVTPRPAGSGGIVDDIRFNTERGCPSSLLSSLDIILSRNLTSSEFGRTMLNVNVTLLRALYPMVQPNLPPRDPPLIHIYSVIIREAERGIYTPPRQNSQDFLEYVLPFLAYYTPFSGRAFPPERYTTVLRDLEIAAILNSNSVLPGYFSGFAHEQMGNLETAMAQYSLVWESFPEAFPAALGIVRIKNTQGRQEEATQFLYELSGLLPGNIEIKRHLAIAWYNSGNWAGAEALAAEILTHNSRDEVFLLMSAHTLVARRAFLEAQAPLDIYSSINPRNTLYRLLRARIQNEAFNNRDAAIGFLRPVLNAPQPADPIYNAAAAYAARLLMGSFRPQEQTEGRELLTTLLSVPSPSHEAISLALEGAIWREDWAEAQTHVQRLVRERRACEDLLAAYTVERARGNNTAAFSYARELFERDRTNEDGNIAYISALIAVGRRTEAAGMIDARLNGASGGAQKSRYYYLRSQTRNNEQQMMDDLRSSLFENPRNLNTIIALFEIFHQRNDERRAVFYLRQALALAPENLRLIRYAGEYGL